MFQYHRQVFGLDDWCDRLRSCRRSLRNGRCCRRTAAEAQVSRRSTLHFTLPHTSGWSPDGILHTQTLQGESGRSLDGSCPRILPWNLSLANTIYSDSPRRVQTESGWNLAQNPFILKYYTLRLSKESPDGVQMDPALGFYLGTFPLQILYTQTL